jgi:hypothetical protein
MFSTVRRATVLFLLLAFLCSALPAVAAPAGRAHAANTPVILGSSLLDQVLSWLSSLWPGQEPRPQGSREKSGVLTSEGGGTENTSSVTAQDRGGMIDPNGGW